MGALPRGPRGNRQGARAGVTSAGPDFAASSTRERGGGTQAPGEARTRPRAPPDPAPGDPGPYGARVETKKAASGFSPAASRSPLGSICCPAPRRRPPRGWSCLQGQGRRQARGGARAGWAGPRLRGGGGGWNHARAPPPQHCPPWHPRLRVTRGHYLREVKCKFPICAFAYCGQNVSW